MRSQRDEDSAWASVLAHTNSQPMEARFDHVVDRVAAGAADAEHRDPRLQFPDVRGLQVDHDNAPSLLASRARPRYRSAGVDPRAAPVFRSSRGIHRPIRREIPVRVPGAGEEAGGPRGSKCSDMGDLRVDQQSHGGREGRPLGGFREARDAERPPDPDLALEDRGPATSGEADRAGSRPPSARSGVPPGRAKPALRRRSRVELDDLLDARPDDPDELRASARAVD